jgi:hypothetical protein
MKQTAVEWLAAQVNTSKWKFADATDRLEIIEQAKEMEKERMIDFVKKFSDFNGITFNEKMISKEFLEKFYNETFKSE